MAGTLHLIAAKGTDNFPEIATIKHPELGILLDGTGEEQDAPRLLMAAGLLTLQEKAGYVPSHDPRPLDKVMPPDHNHHQKRYPLEVVRLLNVIYRNNYTRVYPEWLHFVARYNVPCPYEALPLMLNLATDLSKTQAMTKRIAGSRGRWIVKHCGHRQWRWLNHVRTARRPRLTIYEKKEASVMNTLEQHNNRRFPVETRFMLGNIDFPWSGRFSIFMTDTVENTFEYQPSLQTEDVQRIAERFMWTIHPTARHRLVSAFRTYNQMEETQRITDKLDEVLVFRAGMRQVFHRLNVSLQ